MSAPLQRLLANPVVAILRGVTPDTVLGVAQVLLDAGFRVIEVPLNSPAPLASIEALAHEFGTELLVGAGTVLSRPRWTTWWRRAPGWCSRPTVTRR